MSLWGYSKILFKDGSWFFIKWDSRFAGMDGAGKPTQALGYLLKSPRTASTTRRLSSVFINLRPWVEDALSQSNPAPCPDHPCMGNPEEIGHGAQRFAIAAGHVPFDHFSVSDIRLLHKALLFEKSAGFFRINTEG